MASYVKSKQQVLLTEEKVKAIVEQIENNRFSKSWRTNREHEAYLKDKHSTSKSVNTKTHTADSSKVEKPATVIEKAQSSNVINSETKLIVQERLKSREVPQWTGQVEQENILVMPFTSTNAVFMTPFDISASEDEPAIKTEQNPKQQIVSIVNKTIEDPVTKQTITCPKCHSAMIKRVAKKGARQGQSFYGCSQYPKCHGVVTSA